jgi:hypothetical protein
MNTSKDTCKDEEFINRYNISTVRFWQIEPNLSQCCLRIGVGNERYGTVFRKGDCETINKMYDDVLQCLKRKDPVCYVPPE